MSKDSPHSINRRGFLESFGSLAALSLAATDFFIAGCSRPLRQRLPKPPSIQDWMDLRERVQGRLIPVTSPLEACQKEYKDSLCAGGLEQMTNPFYLEAQPGATQTTGWQNAWKAELSPWAVVAEGNEDVVAAVNFAREHGVKLVIKGTGHDYLGRSNAPNSLLLWTHHMRDVVMHEEFFPAGSKGPGVPTVSVGAGARWLEVYDEVTNTHGRYVQGGGCTSVGAAGGFVMGGGFGALSKRYGMASGNLLEAEVVTADGQVLVATEYQNADLFWALRGGGGGTFGVVTRLTMLTHESPGTIGGLNGWIQAASDDAFRRLLAEFIRFYPAGVNNPHWGETVKIMPSNRLELSLVFIDLSVPEAAEVWQPFQDWLDAHPTEFENNFDYLILPFRDLWNLDYWTRNHSAMIQRPPPTAQVAGEFWWASNQKAVSEYIYNYQSRWLPLQLFDDPTRLAATFFDASRHWELSLYLNKGLAGATPEALERDQKTSINPAVFDAAAWILMMASESQAFPGIAGLEPDHVRGQALADRVSAGMTIIRAATPGAGTYSNEADYEEPDWQTAFWGSNYTRLLRIKRKYDPHHLFQTHHSVGSEESV